MSSTLCQSLLFSHSPVTVQAAALSLSKCSSVAFSHSEAVDAPSMTGETLGAFILCCQLSDDFRNNPPWGFCSVWHSREGTEDSGFVKTCRKIHVLCLTLHVLHVCCHVSGPITETHYLRNSDIAFLQWKNLMSWPLLLSTKYQNPFFPVVTECQV